MVGLRGKFLTCAACWELRNVGRTPTPCTAYLVRCPFTVEVEERKMKKPASLSTAQAGFFPEVDAHDSTQRPVKFHGTDNPRELRAIALLLRRPSVPREALDHEVGCSNGPDLIARLRAYGLGSEHLPCTRIVVIDRDGCKCNPGVYWFTPQGRRAVIQWLRRRKQGALPSASKQGGDK